MGNCSARAGTSKQLFKHWSWEYFRAYSVGQEPSTEWDTTQRQLEKARTSATPQEAKGETEEATAHTFQFTYTTTSTFRTWKVCQSLDHECFQVLVKIVRWHFSQESMEPVQIHSSLRTQRKSPAGTNQKVPRKLAAVTFQVWNARRSWVEVKPTRGEENGDDKWQGLHFISIRVMTSPVEISDTLKQESEQSPTKPAAAVHITSITP